MENREAIEKLERQLKAICLGCKHRSVIGWCENHCRLPEAFNMAISALEEKERNKVHCGECKYMLGGYSGYSECSKNHWRVYKAYSCEDGEKK